jgi:hypothetical protein
VVKKKIKHKATTTIGSTYAQKYDNLSFAVTANTNILSTPVKSAIVSGNHNMLKPHLQIF